MRWAGWLSLVRQWEEYADSIRAIRSEIASETARVSEAWMAERDRADKLAGAITRLRKAVCMVHCPLCSRFVTVHTTGHMESHRDWREKPRLNCPASGRRPEDALAGGKTATGSTP